MLEMERRATVVVQCTNPLEWYIAVKASWFNQYITDVMGDIHDCYIANVSSDFRSITLLGDNTLTPVRQTMFPPSESE